MCFHILGIDIMIGSDLKPYLIEVNHTPSFETGTPLDYKVKKNLITDALKIMRISSKNKKMLFEKAKLMMKNKV
jgi:tubulin polyglutamylase TTLL6/13